MKLTVNFTIFCDSFSDSYKNNFSYEGKKALFEHLQQLEDDIGEEMELDPVAFCCEYSEYDNFEDVKANYDSIETLEDLEDNTTVIHCDNGHLIIQDF